MVKAINEMRFDKKTIDTLNLFKEILAGPTFSNKINGEDNKKVKQALFVFLQESKAIWCWHGFILPTLNDAFWYAQNDNIIKIFCTWMQ